MSIKLELSKNPNACLFLNDRCSFLEFWPEQKPWHGFAVSQLLHYSVEANTAAKDGPPDKLTLGFSTADVVVTGWRLEQLADEVRGHKGGIVKTLPNAVRYEQLQPNACAVAKIEVKPIAKA
jgi:hypothetical protein